MRVTQNETVIYAFNLINPQFLERTEVFKEHCPETRVFLKKIMKSFLEIDFLEIFKKINFNSKINIFIKFSCEEYKIYVIDI